MKDKIHPNYRLTTFTCTCGNVIETAGTKFATGTPLQESITGTLLDPSAHAQGLAEAIPAFFSGGAMGAYNARPDTAPEAPSIYSTGKGSVTEAIKKKGLPPFPPMTPPTTKTKEAVLKDPNISLE